MTSSKFFAYSASIPVILAAVLYYYINADLLGGHVQLRGSYFYEDLDIYSLDHGYKVVEA